MTDDKRRLRRDARGQITERKTARGVVYGLRFALPTRDGDGHPRRVYETLGRSWEGCDRREAEARAERLLAQVRLGQYRTREERQEERDTRKTEQVEVPVFEAFAADWLDRRLVLGGKRGKGLTVAGADDLRWRLSHLNGWFGPLRLDEVTEEEVERYATAKRAAAIGEGGLSATSTNKTLACLESVFTAAVRYRRIDRNPVDGFRVSGWSKRTAHLTTAAQITALLDAGRELDRAGRLRQGHGRALLATLVLGGLRIDEALSLTWRDVDLASGVLRVRDGKTENAARNVDLLAPLREDLADLRARRGGERDALVFATTTGRKDGASNVRRRVLAPAVELANARLEADGAELLPEKLTPHGLRHSFASVLCAVGENPRYVMGQMGHADPGFTLRVYAKTMDRRDGEPDRLRALVKGEELAASIEPDRSADLA